MVRGGLFSRFFLEDEIRQTAAYRCLEPTRIVVFADAVRRRWAKLAQMTRPSEAETEQEFIYPLLDLLDWKYLQQQEADLTRRDIADALLFLNEPAKDKARRQPIRANRFRFGVIVVENEARDTPLDRASGKGEAPSSQILRYISRAEVQSGGVLRWGLLTNGQFWRLYWANARALRPRGSWSSSFGAARGVPPPAPEGAPPDHWLRVFLLLFDRDALVPQGSAGRTFLDEALAEGRLYEQRITAALSRIVFDHVFPEFVAAVARESQLAQRTDPEWLAEAREASLRLLYRLLFLFYAEDRDLLPVRREGYAEYSLRCLREEAAQIADQKRRLSPHARTWWPRLTALFAAIAQGDASMGLPRYNGGLFDEAQSGLLARVSLPDAVLAPLLDAMSREQGSGSQRWINYRDLSVQHLGSIYERLLERSRCRTALVGNAPSQRLRAQDYGLLLHAR